MNITRYELKSAVRTLARHRGFTTVAVLSLGLAIGLNTTMYSVLDTLVAPRMDIPKPEQLHGLYYWGDRRHQLDQRTKNDIYRAALGNVATLTGQWPGTWGALIEGSNTYVHGGIQTVAPDFFAVLGVRPMMGRLLNASDMNASTPPVVIAERLIRHLFPHGEQPLGARIAIDGASYVVVGVLSRESDLGRRTAAWVLPAPGTDLATLPLNFVRVRDSANVGPMIKGIADKIAFLTNEMQRDNRVYFPHTGGGEFHLSSFYQLTGFHAALVFSVLAVLLIACANLANLQLARGIARSRELATRAALGASRRDLVKHLMLESVLLAAAGLVLGITLTFWGMHLLTASIPESIGEFIVEPQISWRLFVFAALSALACVLLIGLVPAIKVSRVNLSELIKTGAGTGSTRRARRQYGFMVIAEIGFALALTCGASLLVRAAAQLRGFKDAFDESMLAEIRMRVDVPKGESWSTADISADLVSRLRAIQDASDATVIVEHRVPDNEITATDPGGKMHVVPAARWGYAIVSPSYLRTMGFTVAHGRDFREGETGPSVIVDPFMARRLWPNTEAVGHMIKFGSPNTPGRWYTVVGVRNPVGLESTEPASESKVGSAYVLAVPEDRLVGAAKQNDDPRIEALVRVRRNPQRTPIFARTALAADTRFTPSFIGTLDEWTGAAAKRENQDFIGTLFSLFAVLALALAALGVYGIVSHSVAERRREIGVRLALGSSARDILRIVLREGNVFALAGLAFGLLMIWHWAPLVSGFLAFPEGDVYSIELYVPAAAFLFVVAVVSAFIPARRATKIDPVEALRCE